MQNSAITAIATSRLIALHFPPKQLVRFGHDDAYCTDRKPGRLTQKVNQALAYFSISAVSHSHTFISKAGSRRDAHVVASREPCRTPAPSTRSADATSSGSLTNMFNGALQCRVKSLLFNRWREIHAEDCTRMFGLDYSLAPSSSDSTEEPNCSDSALRHVRHFDPVLLAEFLHCIHQWFCRFRFRLLHAAALSAASGDPRSFAIIHWVVAKSFASLRTLAPCVRSDRITASETLEAEKICCPALQKLGN